MVECPVCGKWLKHVFALNGHMRLKGDKLHEAYFETHYKQIAKKDATNIEEQLQMLFSLVKEKGDHLETQNNILLLSLTKLVELLEKFNPQLNKPIMQQEGSREILETKKEKTQTFADLIRQYGSFENVIKYIDHYPLVDIIDKDPYLSTAQKREFRDMSRKNWPRR